MIITVLHVMPNSNYLAGRQLEYDLMSSWREKGYNAVRTAGSHGLYDVVAFRVDRKPEFIQAKRVGTESEAKRLIEKFKKETVPSSHYHQVMSVRVKGNKEILSCTV